LFDSFLCWWGLSDEISSAKGRENEWGALQL